MYNIISQILFESFAPNNLLKRTSNLLKRSNNTFCILDFICLSAQIILSLEEFEHISENLIFLFPLLIFHFFITLNTKGKNVTPNFKS